MPASTTHLLLSPALAGTQTAAEALPSHTTPGGIACLTRRLAARDEEAFREFHTRYFDRLYQFLLIVARGEEHEAQEALQETLLRVVRYAREFDTEDAFWCWLKVVARSAARDGGRKRWRYFNLLRDFALRFREEAPAPNADADDPLRGLVEEVLDELDPADRTLISEKYLDGATVSELSASTSLTEKAIESRLLRLRRKLRERLLQELRRKNI